MAWLVAAEDMRTCAELAAAGRLHRTSMAIMHVLHAMAPADDESRQKEDHAEN